jgi:hypothetical protein
MDNNESVSFESQNTNFTELKQPYMGAAQMNDSTMLHQIEQRIQQQYQILAPALVLEYVINDKDGFEWEYDDLFQVCSYFGDIDFLEISGKNVILVYKNFFDAFTCKEYLLNTNNFKSIDKNNNIVIRWFANEDELKFCPKIVDKIKKITNSNFNANFENQANNFNPQENYCSNMNNNLNSYYAAWTLTPNANYDFNSLLANQNYQQSHNNNNNNNNYPYVNYNNVNISNNYINNQNFYYGYNQNQNFPPNKNNQAKEMSYKENYEYEDKKCQDKFSTGKYTCRFDIQIENDKDFQVSRRLIGAKGCNMKKVIEKCSYTNEGRYLEDSVKLRLRGKGSGFKEGPSNKESDEPLHLCISSKYFDKFKIACTLVQELILSVYEEYKKYCEKSHRSLPTLSIKKIEGVYSKNQSDMVYNYD